MLSTLAYGTVHTWSLGLFLATAGVVIFLWAVDAWRSRVLRFSANPLQLPALGLIAIGLIQLLPFGSPLADPSALPIEAVRTLSIDPLATRLTVIQLVSVFVFFAAALSFIDTPRRLRVVARTVIVFGFALAIFGLIQSFTSPYKIYWLRELKQSMPFGPFINRHHFAAYMEMALALPLGLLICGAIDRDRVILYAFASFIMSVALFMTNSRGGILSFVSEIIFLSVMWIIGRRPRAGTETREEKNTRVRGAVLRGGVALSLLFVVIFGVLSFGGEGVLNRLVGSVNSEDPTTGRSHFWGVAVQTIMEHPLLGTGLGSFGLAYPLHDTRNGFYRVEQVHNDYLQALSDAGIVGAAMGLIFIFLLFRLGFARRDSRDRFRRGIATGALAGCFAVLVHSFFDFTLHTTSNTLLFMTLAALATLDGRVEETKTIIKRRKKRRRSSSATASAPVLPIPARDVNTASAYAANKRSLGVDN